MSKMKQFLVIIAVFLAVSMISASSYEIIYTQSGDKIFAEESANGAEIGNYTSSEMLEKSSEGYYFLEKIEFNESYDNAEVILNLDKGFVLEENGVYPMSYKASTNGQVISVTWSLENVKKGDNFAIFVKIEDTSKNYIPWIIVIVSAAIILAFIYRARQKNKARKIVKRNARKAKKEDSLGYLLDTEKKVIELLKSADRNELWQKQIQDSTGFSKAKVSRLVRNLEARGLIVKIPFGNTNKVRMK